MSDSALAIEETRSWLEFFSSRSETESFANRIDSDCEFLGWGRSVLGKAGWMRTRERFLEAFDPIAVTVVDVTGCQGEVSGHARLAAKHRKSEQEIDVFFSFFVRWEDEKIVWMRSLLDTSSLLAQLSLLDLQLWDVIFEP